MIAMNREAIVEKYNTKWKAMRMHMPFMNLTSEDAEILSNLKLVEVLEVENLGDYSDEGRVFDYEIRFTHKNGDLLSIGISQEEEYFVLEGYESFELGEEFSSNEADLQKFFGKFPFSDMLVELQEDIMQNEWESKKESFLNQKIVSGGYDINTSEYYIELENGTKIPVSTENRHRVVRYF